jgi:hypothetical protein
LDDGRANCKKERQRSRTIPNNLEPPIAQPLWETVPPEARSAVLERVAKLKEQEAELEQQIAALEAKPPNLKPPIGDPPPPKKPVKADDWMRDPFTDEATPPGTGAEIPGRTGLGEGGVNGRSEWEQWLWLDAGHRWTGHRRDWSDLGARPESPVLGAAAGRYRDRAGKQPVLFPDCDVHRDQRRPEPRDLAGS